jgi:YD repeat-containing protein
MVRPDLGARQDRARRTTRDRGGQTQRARQAAGNLTSCGHDSATSTYTYDPRNLLASETDATSPTDPSPQVSTFIPTRPGSSSTR